MRFFFALVVGMALALPAAAQTFYVAGDFNGWNASGTQMVDSGDGIHFTASYNDITKESTVGGQIYYSEYKITNGTFNDGCCSPGSNGKVAYDANGDINWTLNTNNNTPFTDGWNPKYGPRIGYQDPQIFGWEIVGAFNGWPGSNDPNYQLTNTGTGVYHGQFPMSPGTYEYKFRQLDATNPWNTSIGTDFGNGSGNNAIRVWSNNDQWQFDLDLPTGRSRAYTTALQPDVTGDDRANAADYVMMRKTGGSPSQYNVWRSNYNYVPWYARGSWDGFAAKNNNLMVDAGNGQFTSTITGLTPGIYEYKIGNLDFSQSSPGNNGKVAADASGNINFHFYEHSGAWPDGWSPDGNRVGYDDPLQSGWEVIGDFTGGNCCVFTTLGVMHNDGGGLYSFQATLGAGNFPFKFRKNTDGTLTGGDWAINIGEDFGNDGANASTGQLAGGNYEFDLDLPHGRWRVLPVGASASLNSAAVPEPGTLGMVMFGLVLLGLGRRKPRG